MNYQEAITKLDRSRDTEANVDVFCRLFGMNELGWSAEFNKRVKANYIESWLCTDTTVGTAIVFFDHQPIAVTVQTARKNGVELSFLNVPGIHIHLCKLQLFLLSLVNDFSSDLPITKLDEEVSFSQDGPNKGQNDYIYYSVRNFQP